MPMVMPPNRMMMGHPPPMPEQPYRKQPHIKKPLNAFMLFMKEHRAEVVAECTLKESAAINQILGKKVGMSSSAQIGFRHDARAAAVLILPYGELCHSIQSNCVNAWSGDPL